MRTTAVLSLLLLSLLVASACGRKEYDSTLDRIQDRGVLVVGTEPEFPPFEYLDETGTIIGFDIDMVREMARELGVELRIDPMAFDSLHAALKTGLVDLIASGMTATPERAKNRAFTDTYFRTKLCLLVGAGSGIHESADVGDKRLVVKMGTTGDMNAKRLFPDARVSKLDTEGACAMEVVTGRADAFLYDQHSIERHHRAHPAETRALLEPLTDEPYAMAVRFGDERFVSWINDFLKRFHADGRYARIHEKHFGHPPGK